MNRRRFTQSLAALFAVPALPAAALNSVTAAAPTPVLGAAQQLWASYFSTTAGQNAVQTVQLSMNLPAEQAKRVVRGFVARGHMSPGAMLSQINSAKLEASQESPDYQDDMPEDLQDLQNEIECECEEVSLSAEGETDEQA